MRNRLSSLRSWLPVVREMIEYGSGVLDGENEYGHRKSISEKVQTLHLCVDLLGARVEPSLSGLDCRQRYRSLRRKKARKMLDRVSLSVYVVADP